MARSVQQNWMILGAIVFVIVMFVSFRSGSSPESLQSSQAKVKSQNSAAAAAADKGLHPLDDLDNYNDFPTLGPFDASVELDEELEAKYENREADLLVCKDYEEDLMLMDTDAKQHLNNEIKQMKEDPDYRDDVLEELAEDVFPDIGGIHKAGPEELELYKAALEIKFGATKSTKTKKKIRKEMKSIVTMEQIERKKRIVTCLKKLDSKRRNEM